MLPEQRGALALEEVHTPLLLVWGDHDRLLSHAGAQQILDQVPGSQLELLPGVGHCAQVEAPQRFSELLLEFVAELRPRVARAAVS